MKTFIQKLTGKKNNNCCSIQITEVKEERANACCETKDETCCTTEKKCC